MSSRIKVAEVVFSLDYGKFGGGAERFTLSLARHLDTSKFNPIVCALWRVNTASEERNLRELLSHGVETFVFADWNDADPLKSFWVAFVSLWKFAGRYDIHIFHSHSQFGDIMLPYLKLFRSTHFIVRTIHDGYPIEWKKRPLRRALLTNFLYPIAFDAEIGVNNHIVARLNQRLLAKVLRRRAMCIYNAIDLDRFKDLNFERQVLRGSLGVKPEEFLIGSIGRLVPGKGFDIFIAAVPEVISSVPQARFLLIGDGQDADFLQRLAHQLGVEDRVIFAGARSDAEHLLRCMDLFVLPSLWEGLPTTILESMAAGIPVVVSDIPGNTTLVQDQVNGWVIPPNNASALARAIVTALQNPHLCREFAQNARRVVERFSISEVTKEYEKLYLSLLTKKWLTERFSHGVHPRW
ncbi:MAG: glycosyltransferase family 4 protein [Candidatus Hadarchaeum sp.]|uniref:glycosyltransferase family 4 protein n=1 Tax=Candidatus Hadarchaeum sp. TaxID=2883567 RepID=UPI003171F0C0